MRYELAFAALAAALAAGGCTLTATRGRDVKVQPAKIYSKEELAEEQQSDELVKKIAEQEAAVAAMKEATPAEAGPARSAPVAEAPKAEAEKAQEMTVDYLLARLDAKGDLTPGEQEAYKRLLGMAAVQAPSADRAEEYNLLSAARDAVARGDYDQAQEKANKALADIRVKTDPAIDRAYFATAVRNYGDGDVVTPASLTAGTRVLAVADVSNFACLPVAGATPPGRFYTRMTQRLAIYDTEGRLYWQQSYERFEYQSAQYTSTMFIPRIFGLPGTLARGQYVLKVEIEDLLAGRQAETSVDFSIK